MGTPTAVPARLLGPGLGLLAVSLTAYALHQVVAPGTALDVGIYRQAAQAFLAGRDVYALTFTAGLPFTYPPVTLPLLVPLAVVPERVALYLLAAVSVAAVAGTAWCTTGLLGHRGTRGRIGVAAAVTAVAVWLEPVTSTLDLGQVNAVLMVLVVADLALPDRCRAKGVGVGLAAAVKIVPGVFAVYLLLTGRVRAAAVAGAAFGAATLVGWLVAPAASVAYWLDGLFLDPSRVAAATGPAFVGNQSLHGLVLRTVGDNAVATRLWLLLAVVVGVGGLLVAVRAHRRGEEAAAVATVAFAAVLAGPVSWSHHWVWVVVLLLVLGDVVRRGTVGARLSAAGLVVAWTAMLVVWPGTGGSGLIWDAYRYAQPWHWAGENVYVPVALGTLVLAARWVRAPDPAPAWLS